MKLEYKRIVKEYNNSCHLIKPLVSVVVVTYQHIGFIKQCIDSILMQKTNFDFEIILGEDASKDGTRELCIEYAKKYYSKIRLFLHDRKNVIYINGNATGRFNMLHNLLQTKGKYIAICEGDDYWTDPLKLQKQVDYLKANPNCSLVVTDRLIVDKNGKTWKDDFYEKNIYTIHDIIKGFVPPTQTMMYRNSPMVSEYMNRLDAKNSGGDRYLGLLFSLFGEIHRLEEITAVYRITGDGVWTSESNFEKLISAYNYFKNFHKSIGIPIDNIYVKQHAFNTLVDVFFYTLKRPKLIFKNIKIAFNIYKELAWSNHFILLTKAFVKKIKALLKK